MCLYPRIIYPRKVSSFRGCKAFIVGTPVKVKCGKCLQCLSQQSSEWALRIMLEAQNYKNNCFVTLTYNNDNLPNPPTISKREVQLFVKRLRKNISPLKVRFFACGEYGSKYGRPHYHLIIFNWYPSDCYFHSRDKHGIELFRSPILEKNWTKGFSTVGKLSYDSARYCAKYMQKTLFQSFSRNKEFLPPFVLMSNRPGIGYSAVYKSDILSDSISVSGHTSKIPRYFLKVMERDGIYLDGLKSARQTDGFRREQLLNLDYEREKFYKKFYSKKFVKKP